jgi:FkbM family methyltransferase
MVGATVLDLGANLGIYSKALSGMVGPRGHVHAVEMMPETYSYLARNVARFGNVTCYNVGVSDRTGAQYARLPKRLRGGGGHIYRAHLADSGMEVNTRRLDDLFPDLEPSFIKCDVEGEEAAVVRGATDLILRCHPVWLIETSGTEIFDLLHAHGYRANKLADDWLFTPAEDSQLHVAS